MLAAAALSLAFTTPSPLRVTPALARAASPLAMTGFEMSNFALYHSGHELAGLDLDTASKMIGQNNMAEDFGGVVGGTYAVAFFGAVFCSLATLYGITSYGFGDMEQVPFGKWRKFKLDVVDLWNAGMALPTLEELERACVVVTTAASERQLLLCSAPSNGVCTPDEEFSDYYGQPVYVCPNSLM